MNRPLRMSIFVSGLLVSAAFAAGSLTGDTADSAPAAPPRTIRFGRDVRPILSDRCFQCHGPDEHTREADLRLDLEHSAHEYAIVPGDPASSELWDRVTAVGEMWGMPPEGSGKKPLSADQQDILRRWIEEGAVYEPHWAFVPPTRPALPEVGAANHPLDRFVRQKLDEYGITPAPPATPAVLLRRVMVELTGLPPTPGELDAFLAEPEDGRLERWIDRIFGEEPYRSRYAERMASPWLDQARYADTCGIHMDAGRQIWPWRDWVLEAYRHNLPYDQFLVEQLAGDLLPDATIEQKVATGFHRNHVTTDEGGAIDEEYLVEYAADRTVTTAEVLLGLTVGCARCHDHKFDPISQEDFYALYAFFNSNEEPGLYSQSPDPTRAHEPFLVLPSDAQKEQEAALEAELATGRAALETMTPDEESAWRSFEAETTSSDRIAWHAGEVVSASSTQGTPLELLEDGSVRAGGATPAGDEYTITLRTDATGLRLLLLEALPDQSTDGKIGRAANGNAVIRRVTVEACSIARPAERKEVRFGWTHADHAQLDQDFAVTNLLDPEDPRVWALGGHAQPGPRQALLLAEEPFGDPGGTDLIVRIEARSVYAEHVPVRVRLTVGAIAPEALPLLPATASRFLQAGPFEIAGDDAEAYETDYGPEADAALDPRQEHEGWRWAYRSEIQDGEVAAGPTGRTVHYLGRFVYAPTARTIEVSLGSDDGFSLFRNGEKVAERRVARGVAADQDRVRLPLVAGRNRLIFKIVNIGGQSGSYYRPKRSEHALPQDVLAVLLPERARSPDVEEMARASWMRTFSPRYAAAEARSAELTTELTELRKEFPHTMVMKELAEPRETFVLQRGMYDAPDRDRPVDRHVPSVLGSLPDDAPRNRLGLARWITSADNPLTARVLVNRLWEQLFGTGLVKTSNDFGFQGEWPSHSELLDWLAVEFRESGWDVQHLLRLLMTSETYCQSSHHRPELAEIDPDQRLLASFPRGRLTAEQIRDQALYVSGLLVEKLGGPSVKPYQPEGLWKEVAMLQSNTRFFERDDGEALWRRSLYTYWKRAAPPPAMLAFDAPTREFCTIRRGQTSTPLQALVLWNDEQFVEAARELAGRTLRAPGDDAARLDTLFRRCTSRQPDERERAALGRTLAEFRARYAADPAAASALLEVGEAPVDAKLDPAELASWTLLSSATLNLYETTTRH